MRVAGPDGHCAYGEIAPLVAFGTESIERAERYLLGLGGVIRGDQAEEVPNELSCCRFALESALTELERGKDLLDRSSEGGRRLAVAGLLPGGMDPVDGVDDLLARGYRTLKWKIGSETFDRERDWFRRVKDRVPKDVRWRLDANGSLDVATVEKWARELEGAAVDYLEQPLPVGETKALFTLSKELELPLALDEAVGTVESLREWRDRGWLGLFVVKPALSGSPKALAEFLREEHRRVVFSSALETGVGVRHALGPALDFGIGDSAVGWGTGQLFGDDGLSPRFGPRVTDSAVAAIDPSGIWNRLQHESWGKAD